MKRIVWTVILVMLSTPTVIYADDSLARLAINLDLFHHQTTQTEVMLGTSRSKQTQAFAAADPSLP